MGTTEQKLFSIISGLLDEENQDISKDLYLIDDLDFDSIQLMTMIVQIEESFGITFDNTDMLFDNFNHIADLCTLVESLLEG